MEATFEERVTAVRRDGPRRFARWDAALFEAVATGPLLTLGQRLAGPPSAELVITAYLRMLEEAIGTQVLRQTAASAAGWSNSRKSLRRSPSPAASPALPGWSLTSTRHSNPRLKACAKRSIRASSRARCCTA